MHRCFGSSISAPRHVTPVFSDNPVARLAYRYVWCVSAAVTAVMMVLLLLLLLLLLLMMMMMMMVVVVVVVDV